MGGPLATICCGCWMLHPGSDILADPTLLYCYGSDILADPTLLYCYGSDILADPTLLYCYGSDIRADLTLPYSYGSDILADLTFTIDYQSTNAVIGGSGEGKSSILRSDLRPIQCLAHRCGGA